MTTVADDVKRRGPADLKGVAHQLARVKELFTSALDERSLVERILTAARELTRAQTARLYIRHGDVLRAAGGQRGLVGLASAPEREDVLAEPRLAGDGSIVGHVAATGHMLNIPDAYRIPAHRPYAFAPEADVRSGHKTRSILALPLRRRSLEVLGVLELVNATDDRNEVAAFDFWIEYVAHAVASEAATALESAESSSNNRPPGRPIVARTEVATCPPAEPVRTIADAEPIPPAPATGSVARNGGRGAAAAPERQGGQAPPRRVVRRLGELIMECGLITPEQLDLALAEQRRSKENIGAVLVRLGFVTEQQLVVFLSQQFKVPAVALTDVVIDPEVLRLVPAEIAVKHELIPLQRVNGSVMLAMADPNNVAALDDVRFLTGLQVFPSIAPPSRLRDAIARFYGGPPARSPEDPAMGEVELERLEVVEGRAADAPIDLLELRTSADEAPVVRLVNWLVLNAIRRRASDVHIEPFETSLRVRFRIDGLLQHVMTRPKRLEAAIVSRVKIMASLDIAERRRAQDGHIKIRFDGREVDLRVAVLPTRFGEAVNMRILDKSSLNLDLATLGFDPWGLEQFQKALRNPYGVILITGPTGSGKTTTLYSAVHRLNSMEVKIVTVEDPIEYGLEGVNQVEVNDAIGRTFASALRSFLRHDPDVVLVGEMRDLETAQVAMRAGLTGHLVLSTLHTNDCASTVPRLIDMGIPGYLVAAALRLVVAQRLVRKLCPACKEPYEIDEESLVPYGHDPMASGLRILYRRKGCEQCHFTGMRGRMGLYQVMPFTEELREMTLGDPVQADIDKVARSQGMRTLREAGFDMVLQGLTTVDEVVRATSD